MFSPSFSQAISNRRPIIQAIGPVPFMREIRGGLLRAGVPARRIRYEVFGPDLWLPAPTA